MSDALGARWTGKENVADVSQYINLQLASMADDADAKHEQVQQVQDVDV